MLTDRWLRPSAGVGSWYLRVAARVDCVTPNDNAPFHAQPGGSAMYVTCTPYTWCPDVKGPPCTLSVRLDSGLTVYGSPPALGVTPRSVVVTPVPVEIV